jgi:hypothetical protein
MAETDDSLHFCQTIAFLIAVGAAASATLAGVKLLGPVLTGWWLTLLPLAIAVGVIVAVLCAAAVSALFVAAFVKLTEWMGIP